MRFERRSKRDTLCTPDSMLILEIWQTSFDASFALEGPCIDTFLRALNCFVTPLSVEGTKFISLVASLWHLKCHRGYILKVSCFS